MASRTLDVHIDNADKKVLESHVLFVDSARRNLNHNPDPSKLVLDFENPFSMVVGFEILDASIPNVMYSVEKHNNMFSLIFSESSDDNSALTTNSHFVEYVASIPISESMENSCVATRFQFVSVSSSPPPSSPMDVTRDTMTVFVEDTVVQGASISLAKPSVMTSTIVSLSKGKYYITCDSSHTATEISASPNSYVVNPSTMTLHRFVRLDRRDVVSNANIIKATCHLSRMDIFAEHGNYTICSLCNHMNTLMSMTNSFPRTNVSAASCTGDFERTSKMMVQSTKAFLVNTMASTMLKQTGYVNVSTGCSSKVVIGLDNYMPLSFLCTDGMWRMPSPGVCDLTGERYIILRCPELENNGSMFKTRTYDGVAIFKMAAAPNNISELRFDYHNLQHSLLHPIGKLSKLTFSFECGDGRPYDFKGVDYQFLACVKTLGVPRIHTFTKSILNPHYGPALDSIRHDDETEEVERDWDHLDKMVAEFDALETNERLLADDEDDDDEDDEDETDSIQEYSSVWQM